MPSIFDALYRAAHTAFIAGIIAGILAAVWLVWAIYRNRRVRHDDKFASKHRRGRGMAPLVAVVLCVAVVLAAGYFNSTRVTTTTVGKMVDTGRTNGDAGLRTEAEVFSTTADTTVYIKLPGAPSWLNTISKFATKKQTTVGVKVAEYGFIDFATVQGATTAIDRGSHTITVNLPMPSTRTYIYQVGGVGITEGPIPAAATILKAAIGSILNKQFVTTDLTAALNAAKAKATASAKPAEIFGCGRQEIQQQLAGIFGTVPAYHGWAVVVNLPPGAPSTSSTTCQHLQAQLVTSS